MTYLQNKFTEIANAFRTALNVTRKIKPSEFAGLIENVFSAGRDAEYNELWDNFQFSGGKGAYSYRFYGWPVENYKPKYPIIASSATGMFSMSKITDTLVDIDISDSALNTIMFNNCTNLVKVKSLTVSDKSTFDGAFVNCTKLTDLNITGSLGQDIDLSFSPLNKASLTKVLTILSDSATDKILKLKQSACDSAFTAEELQALISAKPNWDIQLI